MKKLCFPLWRALAILGGSVCCTVSQATELPVAPLPESLGLSTNLVEVTVNLILVLAAIILLAFIFKRFQGIGQPAAGSLRVVATLPLGPKERILLVQVGDEQIVIGASDAGLASLHKLTTPLAELPVTPEDDGTFREKLLKSMRGVRS